MEFAFLATALLLANTLITAPSAEVIPFPSGIADSSSHIAFVSVSSGGIDAVDLHAGRTMWHTDAAFGALASFNGQIIVWRRGSWANELVIGAVNADGKADNNWTRIKLPAQVAVAAPGFEVTGKVEASRITILWHYEPSFRGGAGRQESIRRWEPSGLSGEIPVDLDKHIVVEKAPGSTTGPDQLLKLGEQFTFQGINGSEKRLWTTDAVTHTLVTEEAALGVRVLLISSGAGLSRTIRLIDARRPIGYVTLDGAHILLSDAAEEKGWEIFSAFDGRHIANAAVSNEVTSPEILDSVLYFLQKKSSHSQTEISLCAFDFERERLLWRYNLGVESSRRLE